MKTISAALLGAPLDPFSSQTRQHIALVAFLAWIGLGADGLSSSCYGPEGAFLALGEHTHLALGGRHRAHGLCHRRRLKPGDRTLPLRGWRLQGRDQSDRSLYGAGLRRRPDRRLHVDHRDLYRKRRRCRLQPAAGCRPELEAVDRVGAGPTASLPQPARHAGVDQILLPIFLGFFVTHVVLILYGIATHSGNLPALIPETVQETGKLTQEMGWVFAVSLFLRAYSLGGGTSTGIEAVSNNVQSLAEPRVTTGEWTMFYMAVSLSFTAGGIILLYLLWQVAPVEGQTLNAVTFRAILASTGWQSPIAQDGLLWVVLALEGGLLLVAANTGFLGGPAVTSGYLIGPNLSSGRAEPIGRRGVSEHADEWPSAPLEIGRSSSLFDR